MLGHQERAAQIYQESQAILGELGARRELADVIASTALYGRASDLETERLLQESLAICREAGTPEDVATKLCSLGARALRRGAYQQAEHYGREALAMGRSLNHHRNTGWALTLLGHVARARGEYAGARHFYEESLYHLREMGFHLFIANVYDFLGHVAFAQGEYTEAGRRYRQGLALYRDLQIDWLDSPTGECWGVGLPLVHLGDVALAMGEERKARQYYRQAFEIALDRPYVELKLDVLSRQAALLASEGRWERATELITLALHHPASAGEMQECAQKLLAELRAKLPPEVFAAAQKRGRARDLEATLEELLADEVGDGEDRCTPAVGTGL